MNKTIKAIVFDMVGVLVEFNGSEKVFELSGGVISHEMFGRFWTKCDWALGFSKGIYSPEAFSKGAVDYFGLDISPEAFVENYKTWYAGPYPGAIALVKTLKKRFKVSCLSNINEIYTPVFLKELHLDKIMDDCVFSNEVGLIKPDLEIYALAAKRLDIDMDRILFFDDNQENVDAALMAGMQAERVDGPGGVQQILIDYEILHA